MNYECVLLAARNKKPINANTETALPTDPSLHISLDQFNVFGGQCEFIRLSPSACVSERVERARVYV